MIPYFKLLSTDGGARRGQIITDRGVAETPVFMPVGTLANIKGVPFNFIKNSDIKIILANTYHLYLRPGMSVIKKLGGVHSFSGYKGTLLTDSGGFQIFSLAKMAKITELGYAFQSHIDGSRHVFTPENVIDYQQIIGSQIMMPLDECLPFHTPVDKIKDSVNLTLSWLKRGLAHFNKKENLNDKWLFAIIQGANAKNERIRCTEEMVNLDLPGYSIGGLSVGEENQQMYEIVNYIESYLPRNKPRYLMGVGKPQDILNCIELGIDMFDCVLPTRNARNATVYTFNGKLNLRNKQYQFDNQAIEEDCDCHTCQNHHRAYLRHLFKSDEMNGPILASIHNLHFFEKLTSKIRRAIKMKAYQQLKSKLLGVYPLKDL